MVCVAQCNRKTNKVSQTYVSYIKCVYQAHIQDSCLYKELATCIVRGYYLQLVDFFKFGVKTRFTVQVYNVICINT